MSEKTVAIRIDEELHKRIKIRLAQIDMTLKDYIVQLVNNDLAEAERADFESIPETTNISPKSIKEAQKILDFVSELFNVS